MRWLVLTFTVCLVSCSAIKDAKKQGAPESAAAAEDQAPAFEPSPPTQPDAQVASQTPASQEPIAPQALPKPASTVASKPWVQMATSKNCEACQNMKAWLIYYRDKGQLPFELYEYDVDVKGWPAGVDTLPAFAWKRSDGVVATQTSSIPALIQVFNQTYTGPL